MYQRLCACGCGTYFTAFDKGHLRKYLNNTHKKRAQRERENERRQDTPVVLTATGWLYLKTDDKSELDNLWDKFTDVERRLIELVCWYGFTPTDIMNAANRLWDQHDIAPTNTFD
jgi:hypothetical protein